MDGPFEQDPEATIERIKNALPEADVLLEHKLIAASAGEIPDDLMEAIKSAEYGKVDAPAPPENADDD